MINLRALAIIYLHSLRTGYKYSLRVIERHSNLKGLGPELQLHQCHSACEHQALARQTDLATVSYLLASKEQYKNCM